MSSVAGTQALAKNSTYNYIKIGTSLYLPKDITFPCLTLSLQLGKDHPSLQGILPYPHPLIFPKNLSKYSHALKTYPNLEQKTPFPSS